MFLYSKSEMHNNICLPPQPKKKSSLTKNPVLNDVRIQYKKNETKQKQHSIIQREIIYYNSNDKKTVKVSNLQQLKGYYSFIGETVDINYTDFPNMANEDVDVIILSWQEQDLYSMITGNILDKNELIDKINKKNTDNISSLKESLKGRWKASNNKNDKTIKQKGDFIGNPKDWHVHTNIGTQEHFKRGNGTRYATNSPDTIIIAVRSLIADDGLSVLSGQECYRWLRYTMIERHEQDLPPGLRYDI